MTSDYFIKDLHLIPQALGGIVLMYVLIILYTRLYGLRAFSKMTSFDFANTIAIGSLIAMTVATGKPSLLMGVLLIGFLYLLNYVITIIRFRSKKFHNLVDNTPLLLMKDGKYIERNLHISKVTEDEVREKLREANVLNIKDVKAVVLEVTGDVNVLHASQDVAIDPYLLEGVRE